MKASNHVMVRYLERELDVAQLRPSARLHGDGDVLRALAREQRVDLRAVRRDIERVFKRPRMTTVARWADGASFRVIVNGRTYCCRGNTVTTFYRQERKGRSGVGRRKRRRGRHKRQRLWEGRQ